MKNNSCLLDRLYCTKCYYIQIHLLSMTSYTFHALKRKREGGAKKRPHKKKLNVPLYENRKYQIKMCTDSLSCYKEL